MLLPLCQEESDQEIYAKREGSQNNNEHVICVFE